MKRIKTFGLAVVMALALTALVGAASASATQFRSEAYPTTLNGVQGVQQKMGLANKTELTCTTASMSGQLSAASSSVTLTPEFSGCQWAGLSAAPKVNSCKYTLNSNNEEIPFTGTMDVSCNGGDAIEFILPSKLCTLKIPAQTGLKIDLANSGFAVRSRNRKITATMNVSGLKYTITVLPWFPEACGGNATREDGTWTGTSVLSGYDAQAKHAWGVYLADKQVEAPPLFSDESLNGTITSDGTATMEMNFPGALDADCKFKVTAPVPGWATDVLDLNVAEWSNCSYGSVFSVNPNGCTLGLQATTSENQSAWGVLNITCPPGASITMTGSFGMCTVSIPAQTNRPKLTFETLGSGAERKVSAKLSVTGLKFTSSGSFCNKVGTFETGELFTSLTLKTSKGGLFIAY